VLKRLIFGVFRGFGAVAPQSGLAATGRNLENCWVFLSEEEQREIGEREEERRCCVENDFFFLKGLALYTAWSCTRTSTALSYPHALLPLWSDQTLHDPSSWDQIRDVWLDQTTLIHPPLLTLLTRPLGPSKLGNSTFLLDTPRLHVIYTHCHFIYFYLLFILFAHFI
jgi:hypothetical protein